jgi:predicted DNA binding CopG/RHH family protein
MFRTVVSKDQNFKSCWVVNQYNTKEEAEQNYEQDLNNFKKKHRRFWLENCFGHSGIVEG